MISHPKSLPLRPLLIGLAITLAQLGFVLSNSPEPTLHAKYLSLYHADALWYGSIVERGYVSTLPPTPQSQETSNVAFLPVYPHTAKLLRTLFGISTPWALLLTAQFFNAVFWAYVIAFAESWGASTLTLTLGALLIAAHPAAFYLVSAYSESTFLAFLVGFLFWLSRSLRDSQKSSSKTTLGTAHFSLGRLVSLENTPTLLLTALHGVGTSASRIVGSLCVLAPVVQSLLTRRLRAPLLRGLMQPVLLSLLSTLGILSFFLFCELRFGAWDLYFLTEAIGWGIRPDYLGVFRSELFDFAFRWHSPQDVGMSLMVLTWFLWPLIFLLEVGLSFRKNKGEESHQRLCERIGFYFAGFAIYYVSVCGTVNGQFFSMLRFQLCTHILIVLAGMQLFTTLYPTPYLLLRSKPFWRKTATVVALLFTLGLIVGGFWAQARFARMFESNLWVA